MTDEEIYQAALTEWTGVLAQLWIGVGKPVEQDRLRIYRDQLQTVPLGLLELVIARTMRENTYSNVPNIGVIWDAVRKELGLGINSPHYVITAALPEWRPIFPSRLERRSPVVSTETPGIDALMDVAAGKAVEELSKL